jgi:1,4-alpha-glucan branching enzyme
MHRFEVWAPLPKKVELRVNGSLLPMHGPDEQGWWHLDVDNSGPGADYCYLIDGDEKCYPDPRSQWQPNGVHGMSRLYSQDSFSGAMRVTRRLCSQAALSMSCILAPSLVKARWMRPSASWIIL